MTTLHMRFICGSPGEAKTCDRCRSRIRGVLLQLPEQFVYLTMSRQRVRVEAADRPRSASTPLSPAGTTS
ncbi:hypothetical protein ACWGGS_19595 [Streptomyces decoyicus]